MVRNSGSFVVIEVQQWFLKAAAVPPWRRARVEIAPPPFDVDVPPDSPTSPAGPLAVFELPGGVMGRILAPAPAEARYGPFLSGSVIVVHNIASFLRAIGA